MNFNGISRIDGIESYSLNQGMTEAASFANPKPLYKELWYEGELSCLFADTNLGKSILAVDIAREVAEKGFRVIYFDFELSMKQFQMRYTNDDGEIFLFPENLYRGGMDYDSSTPIEDVINAMESHINRCDASVVIVDNLTWLCNASENGEEAGTLMARLKELKARLGISMLVIAHTPKRDMSQAILDTDLAGSRKLANFFDSMFAIGRSAKDDCMRYIKQIKCRYGMFTHGAENIILCHIEKNACGCTTFVEDGFGKEFEHLRKATPTEDKKFRSNVASLRQEGYSIRDIAELLQVTRWKVEQVLKKLKAEE